MATLYFTNNADSGEGSLRDTISKAVAEDTVSPSPTIADKLITISLSSPIIVNNTLNFDGLSSRVRLDGQGISRLVQVALQGTTVTFKNFDFVNGYNASTCGGICTVNSGTSLNLINCLIAGNYNNSVGDISTVSSSVVWENVSLLNCICCGGNTRALSANRCVSYDISTSTIAGYVIFASLDNRKSIILTNEEAQTAGFVSPPPAELTSVNWNKDLWKDWDFRLTLDSPYLIGNPSAGYEDYFGRERKPDGALGAIEGSWLVLEVDEEITFDDNTIIDYGDIKGNIQIADGKFLTIKEIIKDVDDGSETTALIHADNKAYFSSTNAEDLLFSNVIATGYNANVIYLKPGKFGITWGTFNPEASVLLEKEVDGAWETIEQYATGGFYEITLEYGAKIRIFDGERFTSSILKKPVSYNEIAESYSVGIILPEEGSVGYIQ